MANPILPLIEKYIGPHPLPRLKRMAVGLAQDFWKDGKENPFSFSLPKVSGGEGKKEKPADKTTAPTAPSERKQAEQIVPVWHALPGEVSEKMWGDGSVTPGDSVFTEMLIKPLGLSKEHSVLDLSAGLGVRLRRTVEETGAYITGLEPDPQIAARGMELSVRAGKSKHAAISHYDPNNLKLEKRYDCIIARETFYRVSDRAKFFAVLAAAAKPGAQIAFTDYIVNPEDKDKPAVKNWLAFEKGANPSSMVDMAVEWGKVGFKIRVHDDQTDLYKKEVMAGVKRLAIYLATGGKPDQETKASLLKRVQTWALRVAAMEQGMKFIRFYGTKV